MDDKHPISADSLSLSLYCASKSFIASYTTMLSSYDITFTQYLVLQAFLEKPSMAMATLCKKLHLDSGTLTPVISKLIIKGFLSKKPSKIDKRSILLVLKKKGKLMLEKLSFVDQGIQNLFYLKEGETKKLIERLDALTARYEEINS